jgi:hypothetical protein
MIMLRAFYALMAGFVVVLLVQAAAMLVLKRRVPSWAGAQEQPGVGYTLVNGGILLMAAAAGGWVTAQLAQANPLVHTLGLALVMLLMSALTAMQSRGRQPVWYLLLMLAIAPLGVFAGGIIFLRWYGLL